MWAESIVLIRTNELQENKTIVKCFDFSTHLFMCNVCFALCFFMPWMSFGWMTLP